MAELEGEGVRTGEGTWNVNRLMKTAKSSRSRGGTLKISARLEIFLNWRPRGHLVSQKAAWESSPNPPFDCACGGGIGGIFSKSVTARQQAFPAKLAGASGYSLLTGYGFMPYVNRAIYVHCTKLRYKSTNTITV